MGTHRSHALLFVLGLSVLALVVAACASSHAEPGAARGEAPTVGLAARPQGDGYWLVDGYGRVAAFGAARAYSTGPIADHIVAIAPSATGRGYWLASADGTVRAFGDARALRGARPDAPVVAMTATPRGDGYWLVSGEGSVHAYGAATAFGTSPAASTAVAIAGTRHGYWTVSADGAVVAHGDARAYPHPGLRAGERVTGIAATPSGSGYWLALNDGHVLRGGDAANPGTTVNPPGGVIAIASAPAAPGFWTVSPRGAVFASAGARWFGTTVRTRTRAGGAPRVTIYGDSLVNQSESELRSLAHTAGWREQTTDYPGLALCDLLPVMSEDARAGLDVAVFAFYGNKTTPCVRPHLDRPIAQSTVVARYKRAAQMAIAVFAAEGTRVVLAAGPPSYGVRGFSALDRMFQQLAAEHPNAARFYDAGALLAGPGRTWAATLPCRADETAARGCHDNRIVVRARDKIHFCPVLRGSWNEGCATWS